MDKKIILYFVKNYKSIVNYMLGISLLFIVGLNIFIDELNRYILYLFFIILGIYIGVYISNKAFEYKKREFEKSKEKEQPIDYLNN